MNFKRFGKIIKDLHHLSRRLNELGGFFISVFWPLNGSASASQIFTIVPETLLYRRINQKSIRKDGRLSSSALKGSFALRKNSNEWYLSVDIAELTTPEQTATVYSTGEKRAAAAFTGQVLLNLSLKCEHMPIDNNFAHAGIYDEDIKQGRRPIDDFKELYAAPLAEACHIVYPEALLGVRL